MRVELTIDGGFAYIPGLKGPVVVDASSLSADDAAELRRLCVAAVARAASGALAQRAPLPDARRYRLAFELDGVRHEVVVSDPIPVPEISAMIDFVRERGTR